MNIFPKLILNLSLFLLVQTAFSQNELEENRRLECMQKTFADYGIDLNSKLDSIENYLIQTKQLENNSGEAYFVFFKNVGNSKEHFTILAENMIKKFVDISSEEFYSILCLQNFNNTDSTLLVNKLDRELKEVVTRDAGFEFDHIANKMLDILKEEDFDRPYFRQLSLLYIANSSLLETPELLNMVLQNGTLGEPCPFIPLELTSDNIWILHKTEMNDEKLVDYLTKEFSLDPSKFCLLISTSRKSAYSTYLSLNKSVARLYTNERKRLSQSFFNKNYDELNLVQRIQIEEKIPIQVRTQIVD